MLNVKMKLIAFTFLLLPRGSTRKQPYVASRVCISILTRYPFGRHGGAALSSPAPTLLAYKQVEFMVADDQPSSIVALTGLSRTLLARGARGALQLGGLLLPAARRPAAAAAGSVAAGPVPTRAHGGSPSASTWTNHTREPRPRRGGERGSCGAARGARRC